MNFCYHGSICIYLARLITAINTLISAPCRLSSFLYIIVFTISCIM